MALVNLSNDWLAYNDINPIGTQQATSKLCRLCGNQAFGFSEDQLCKDCMKKMDEWQVRQYIKELGLDKTGDLCSTCLYHYKACVCPEGKAVRSMKDGN